MTTLRQPFRLGLYTLGDAILVVGLGLLGGIVNVTISSIPHPHFMLWGARVPYGSFFVLAPVIAMLLVRKPGVAFVTALVYGLVQAIARANWNSLSFGFMEGLGAEIVFALFRYQRFDALSAFLAGGIGARTPDNLWSLVNASASPSGHVMPGMSAEQFAPWQTFVGGEILGLLVLGVLSGLVGWALAKLIERTPLMAWLNARWGHASSPAH